MRRRKPEVVQVSMMCSVRIAFSRWMRPSSVSFSGLMERAKNLNPK